jgi:hypothetical protein
MPEIRSPLPCLICTSPQAADVRIAVGQGMFERGANLSPNGTPMMCCKVRIVVDVVDMPAAPAAPSATGRFSFGGRRSAGGWPPWRQPPIRQRT